MRYDVNVLGTKGPRKMTAIVPAIDVDSGRPMGASPSIHADNSIMDRSTPPKQMYLWSSQALHCTALQVTVRQICVVYTDELLIGGIGLWYCKLHSMRGKH